MSNQKKEPRTWRVTLKPELEWYLWNKVILPRRLKQLGEYISFKGAQSEMINEIVRQWTELHRSGKLKDLGFDI